MKVVFLRPLVGKRHQNVVRDFVYGCWCNGRRIGGMEMPPLNELYVATHVKRAGVEVTLLDVQQQPECYDALLHSRLAGVMAIVMMSSTQSFRSDAQVAATLKTLNPSVQVILFGSHPTFMPRSCLKEKSIDYVVMREPEETTRCLVSALLDNQAVGNMPGVGYRSPSGNILINAQRPFMDMDDLPIPDRSLLPNGIDYFNPVVRRMPYTTMQTSRGCPGQCIFCTAPVFFGNRWRARSAAAVIEELRIIKQMGYREVFFRDETFTAFKRRNQEICETILHEKMDLSWIANGRVDMVDREMLSLMKKAGCHMVKFGVETGNNQLLDNYRKGTTCSQAENAFRIAAEVGLDTHAHVIFGGQGETPDTIRQTVKFVLKLAPTTATFGILTPYPGTDLFEMVAKSHPEINDGTASNMENLHVDGFYSDCICGMDGVTLSKAVTCAYRRFYFRPSYLLKRLASVRSFDQLMVLGIAGMNIIQFSLSGKK